LNWATIKLDGPPMVTVWGGLGYVFSSNGSEMIKYIDPMAEH
jgi:hypothetical protein